MTFIPVPIDGPIFLPPHSTGPGVRRYARTFSGKIAKDFLPASINRHTVKPHEHKREIARNLRRARDAERKQ